MNRKKVIFCEITKQSKLVKLPVFQEADKLEF